MVLAVVEERLVPLTPSPRGANQPRGLAALTGLNPAEEELARYLRELHSRLGMTSKQLAVALTEANPKDPVSEFQLSRYLGGKALPKLSLVSRLHDLLAERAGRPAHPDAVRRGRELVFAAAQAKGPLMAREVRLEAALEDLESQRVQTAEELTQLRQSLAEEEQRLSDLEGRIGDMAAEARRDQREGGDEREETHRRISLLEDLVRQHEAMLRLMQQEASHVETMMSATGKEIELWKRHELVPAGSATAAAPDSSKQIAKAIVALRDQDSGTAADELIVQYVAEASPDELVSVSREFDRLKRPLENERLLKAIAARRSAAEILHLSTYRPYSGNPTVWDSNHLPFMASEHAPLDTLILLVKLLRETGQEERLERMAYGARNRPDSERQQLISVGLKPSKPDGAGIRRLWRT
ncbi:hypothetical protein [Streptomyces sp. NPDC056361]|uniref:hypothetical protein n=1 Tax=Streptomyces sp. NPDC056361 TaxID=3345795 RepID=UPI0035DF47AB